MARIPIALQLYSVREDCARDFSGTLAAVAQMGYEGVEFAGYYSHSAEQLKKLLGDLGLKCAGTHTGIDTLRGDALQATIDFHKTLDNPFLIVPGLPEEYYASKEKWLEFARELTEIAERAKEQGMKVGYHNHWAEFKEFDGETLLESFLKATPQHVTVQFDTGNALHGGGDVVPLLEKYPGRAGTIHLKEHSATNDKALIGEGDVPWQRVFTVCEQDDTTKWYIVEQESYAYPPLECVDKCLQNLQAMRPEPHV